MPLSAVQQASASLRQECVRRLGSLVVLTATVILASTLPLHAQDPWSIAVGNLRDVFTGPIARGLSLVSIVIGGLVVAFDEGQNKRLVAGILFGVGMAIGAVNFMNFLFPGF